MSNIHNDAPSPKTTKTTSATTNTQKFEKQLKELKKSQEEQYLLLSKVCNKYNFISDRYLTVF